MAEFFNQSFNLLVSFDVHCEILCDVLELIFGQLAKLFAEATDCLREEIVNDMGAFGVQFVQEQLDLVLDAIIFVLKHHANVDDFTLKLEHVIQDQVSNDHESLLANMNLRIVQQHEDVLHSLVQQVWETVEKISQSDDDVCLNTKLNVRLDKLENQVKILTAHN